MFEVCFHLNTNLGPCAPRVRAVEKEKCGMHVLCVREGGVCLVTGKKGALLKTPRKNARGAVDTGPPRGRSSRVEFIYV